ncbi:MAG: peptidoglycan bridge formation glycyltransferase FemA/FemB family protein [Armatimonadetes bacterium]|nr:peptidoglycan bridge formation glycyltransferase FemA/FemB family protein [Armatimonadota bacterium]
MKLIECGEPERTRWNEFVAWHPRGDLLQSFEWGDLKARHGWIPIRLAAEEDGRIVAAASLLKRPLPIPGKSFFYASRGPVFDTGRPEALSFLLEGVRKRAAEEGAILLKIDPAIETSDELAVPLLAEEGFAPIGGKGGFGGTQPKCVMQLALAPSAEELLANCKQKARYNIRLAERKGALVRGDCTREDVPVFYDLLVETARRDGFLVRGLKYYEDMWDILVEKGLARLFLVEYEGEAIAGALSFLFGDKCWYTYGASSNQCRNVMPNHLLQWKMILWAKERGCAWYDFRGVSPRRDHDPDDHLAGLNRFKEGFSPRFVEYIGEFDLPYSRPFYWLWTCGKPALQNLMKKVKRTENQREAAE